MDAELCGVADRLNATGHHHTLEAEVRLTAVEGDHREYDFSEFLPEFREKGTVTIIDATGNRIFHSSPHIHFCWGPTGI